MKKSMYSLMLMDDLVSQIDKLAYANNTNRSNMINQIIAKHLSLTTPEMRSRELVGKIRNIIHDVNTFQVQSSSTDQGLQIKSSLSYKYRPTIRYVVEFNKSFGKEIGLLKISFRTQSPDLLEILDTFFKIWISIEERHLGKMFPKHELAYLIGEGRLNRTFMCYDDNFPASDVLSETIASYIRTFDFSIKSYLNHFNPYEVETYYQAYLEQNYNLI